MKQRRTKLLGKMNPFLIPQLEGADSTSRIMNLKCHWGTKTFLSLFSKLWILFNISPWKDRKLRDLGKVIPPNIMPPYSIIIIVFNTNIISGSSCNRFYSYFYSLWCHSSVQLEICGAGEYCAKCGFSVKSSTSAIHISNDCLICVRFWQYQIEVKFLTFMHPSKMCLKYVSGKKK